MTGACGTVAGGGFTGAGGSMAGLISPSLEAMRGWST
jgi:hypothetical protein